MEVLTNVSLSPEQLQKVVEKEGGCFVWGDAARLSPADAILIKVEKALDIDSEGQLIASVLSKKAAAGATHVIIEVNGIGYEVFISLATYSKIKDEESCMLYTHFHVKEDSQSLFGFLSEADKNIFLDLISISGIGPTTAMVMQSSLSTGEIKAAIVNEDVKTIQQIKGIGAKTAQRVVLELKDKLRKEGFSGEDRQIPGDFNNNLRAEALSALVMLGINRNTAQKSIETVLRSSENNITLEELIKRALQAS